MKHVLIPPTPTATEYATAQEGDAIPLEASPFALFADWLKLAREHEINDPNAMTLATVDKDGMPDARMVLLKECEAPHLGFYTNFESTKGNQLAINPKAALVFHWKSLRRQVRVRGKISRNTDAASDAYFASRSRLSQIGARTSKQSAFLDARQTLMSETKAAEMKYPKGEAIPRPSNWGGYLLKPTQFEFWQDQPYRLHDRVQYIWDAANASWALGRLYP